MLQGGDISKWQNTSAVDLFRDFVIIKATEGVGYVDPTCDTKYQYAKSKGKLLGVYDFARPDLGSAIAEADYFVDNTTGYWQAKECILVLDWESGNLADVNWALTWLRRVRDRTGVKPLIYMSASTLSRANWQPVVNEDFGLWIAGYPNKYNVANPPVPAEGEMPYNTSPWGFAAIWQYTSSAGTLDRDVAYMSREAWAKYAGGGVEYVTAAQLKQLYNDLLGRDPDASGIATYQGKVTYDDAKASILGSDEYKTRQATKVEDITDETVIPFTVVRNPDSNKFVGDEVTVQDGVNGKRVVVTRVTTVNGAETGRQVISDKTTPAVNEVVYYGTKEKPADPEPEQPSDPTPDPEVPSENGGDVPESNKTPLEVLKAFIFEQVTKLLAHKDKIIAWVVSQINKLKRK